jgi:hypothetical protein
VLISPQTTVTTLEPENVSSWTPSTGETTGFMDAFKSADSALVSQADSHRATVQAKSVDSTTSEEEDSPVRPVPDRSSREAYIRNTITNAFSQGAKVATTAIDRPVNRSQDKVATSQDSKGKEPSKDDPKASSSPAPAPPPAVPAEMLTSPVPAITLAPAPPVSAPGLITSRQTAAPTSAANNIYADDRKGAALTGEPLPTANPETTPGAELSASELSVKGTGGETPGNLAFAIKVQPARILAGPSRSTQVTSADTSEGAGSESAAANRGTTSAPSEAARQANDSGSDRSGSDASDAAVKAADKDKDKANVEEAKQSSAMPDGSSWIVQTGSAVRELSRDGLADAAQSDGLASGHPAPTQEPASSAQTAPPAGPMKEISMSVEAPEGPKVDIRIVQHAGDLRIAVKSADNDTTQGLRHGLSDLANRLNETGYHAETWRPGQQATLTESASASGDLSNRSSSDGSQSHSGSSSQNRGQRDNNPSNRPRWIQELESNLGRGAEPTGQFNGIVS